MTATRGSREQIAGLLVAADDVGDDTDESLLAGDTAAARVPGYGPVPAAVARRLIAAAAGIPAAGH